MHSQRTSTHFTIEYYSCASCEISPPRCRSRSGARPCCTTRSTRLGFQVPCRNRICRTGPSTQTLPTPGAGTERVALVDENEHLPAWHTTPLCKQACKKSAKAGLPQWLEHPATGESNKGSTRAGPYKYFPANAEWQGGSEGGATPYSTTYE